MTKKDLEAENERLTAECQRLADLLAAPDEMKLEMTRGKGEFSVKHWAVKAFAASFHETLGAAENFVTMNVWHEDGPMTVTVQRMDGKPPSVVIGEMRALLRECQPYVDDKCDKFDTVGNDLLARIDQLAPPP